MFMHCKIIPNCTSKLFIWGKQSQDWLVWRWPWYYGQKNVDQVCKNPI